MSRLSLNFLGDISFGEMFENINHGVLSKVEKGYDPFYFVKEALKKADLNIGNMECVLSDLSSHNDVWSKVMRCPESYIKLLKDNNIHVLNLANNHTKDHGKEAFIRMKELLLKNGINVIGDSYNKLQDKPLFISVKEKSIALSGYYIEETASVSEYKDAIESIKKSLSISNHSADITILSLHWGHEYTRQPRQWQIDLLLELKKTYRIDILYGHHTHTLQGVCNYDNTIFAPSLGNFIFDARFKKNRISAMLNVSYDIENSQFFYNQLPVYINENFQPVPAEYYKSYINTSNEQLYKLITGKDNTYNDQVNKKESAKGHQLNRIKIRILVLLRLRNYMNFIIQKGLK